MTFRGVLLEVQEWKGSNSENTVFCSLRQLRMIQRAEHPLLSQEGCTVDIKFSLVRIHEDGKYDFLRFCL